VTGVVEIEGLALDAHLAGDFEAVVAQRLDRSRDEFRDRKGLGVEPGLAGDLVVGILRSGIDAGEVDFETRLSRPPAWPGRRRACCGSS
jgi:hypothetical protein